MTQKTYPARCSCGADLTSKEAVAMSFLVGGYEFGLNSELDFNGHLKDPENLEGHGQYVGSSCRICDELLEVEPAVKRFTWLDLYNRFAHLIGDDEMVSSQDVTIFHGGEFFRCLGLEQTIDEGHWFLQVEKVGCSLLPQLRKFDISCDARIGVTILAESQEEALRKWERVCASIQENDSIPGDQFYVSLEEPKIEEREVE